MTSVVALLVHCHRVHKAKFVESTFHRIFLLIHKRRRIQHQLVSVFAYIVCGIGGKYSGSITRCETRELKSTIHSIYTAPQNFPIFFFEARALRLIN